MVLSKKLIRGALVVNDGERFVADVFIDADKIVKVCKEPCEPSDVFGDEEFDLIPAEGLHLLPGVIDDQVHFRDPGLTYKGDIYTESKAAVAGGVTSFMDMPNTIPNVLTQAVLEEKYQYAANHSFANFSFYMGASNDNITEVLKTDPEKVCGIKMFLGSSTGDMLVDNEESLNAFFSQIPMLIATHCEDEETIKSNNSIYYQQFGDNAPPSIHPVIRSAKACYLSSSKAVGLAKKYNTRLHVLHLSSAEEMDLFDNSIPLKDKRITAEVCIHHLWFSDKDYEKKGNFIKWNPAIKSSKDREALRQAVNDDRIDIVATDHAPHTLEEKERAYFKAPSGGPMVQHSLLAMLEMSKQGLFSLEKVVEKMCHNPSILFRVKKRGYIKEAFFADLVLVDLNADVAVNKDNILYKCGWSPMEGMRFGSRIVKTFVNGNIVFDEGRIDENHRGKRLLFHVDTR